MSHSFWCSFQDACCLTFQTSTMQKPRVFAAFQTKTSQLTPKLHNHKTRKAWYLRHFRQNATKKQEQKTWENENPETSSCSRKPRKTQGFPVFLLKYLPNINDAPGAAADARASLLLLLLLTLLMLLLLRLSCCRLDCCCSQRFFHVSAAASRSRSHSHR